MAVNFKMSNSKKTIVIAILTIILLTVAVAGTVVFLKDRGSSEAADIDEMTYDNKTINDNNQTSSTDNTQEQISDEQNVEENNNANSVDNRNNINNTNNLVGNQTTSQTRQNTTASNQTDSIQESTIERVEQIDIPEQKISEEHHIGWTSMDVKPIVLSDTLKVSKLNIQKTSEIVGKENGEVAEKGDQIIYTISIENTGDVEKTTTVKDVKLQELIENGILKISEDSQEIAEKLISGMKVDIEAKSTKEIKFIAQILKIDGNIVNIARVGNEEVENKIDTYGLEVSKKLVNIERTGESIDINLPAKKNDVLTYEITLKNTGSTDVNNIDIKDNLPENLVTEDNVEFTNISIKAGEKIRKQIKATVQNVEGKIVNEVIVTDKENDKTLEPAIETIETIDMSIEKKAELIKAESNNNEDYSEFAEVGDKIKYTIILSNNGSVTLENVNIKDIMPEAEEKIITIKAGEKNLEVLAFEHKVIATDFEIDEVGKLKTIYNKAVATYEDEKDPENDITVDDEKEITVRDSYEYTVEYYYNNIKDESKTYTQAAQFASSITEYEDKNIYGYKFKKVENLPLVITQKDNVIRVYYVIDEDKIKDLSYTVEYYKNNVKVEGDTQVEKTTVQVLEPDTMNVEKTKINTVDKYYGYKFEKTTPEVLPDIIENGGVIKVYYVIDEDKTKDLSYTVEYYKNNVKVEEDTQVEKTKVQVLEPDTMNVDKTKINTVDKYYGYKFEKTTPEVLPDTIENGGVIKVYYVIDEDKTKDLSYTVEYYKNNVKVEEDTQVEKTKVQVLEPDTMNVDKTKINTVDKYYGYKFEKTTPEVLPDIIENGGVIKVYYVIDEDKTKDLSYTVEYYKNNVKVEEDTQVEKTKVQVLEPDTMNVDKTKINIVDKYYGYKFEKTTPEVLPDTIENGGVIKVYYVAKQSPELKITKTAINSNGNNITSIIYTENTKTFYYRLKVENTILNSYPEVVESQKIQDILPNGMKVNGDISSIKVNGTETAEITKENITIDGVEREKLIWTAKNIGYGEDAKYIDIPVIINEEVFKNIQREDLGSETTVLDVQFSQDGKSDKYLSGKDTTGKKVNLFLRTAGKTNKNNGYIYAGQSTISTKPSKSVYADSTYNTMLNTTKESTVDEKVTSDLNNSSKLVSVLDNFTEANENGTMSKYISGGLPSKASINKVLGDIYNNTVKISDTQVILWYKVSINNDQKLQRYYKISGTSFGKYVDIPTCSYHLDGVIVDIRSLGTRIPTGAQVNVTNTAQLIGITGNNSTSSAKISIYYKSMSSARRFSIASYTYVPKESINEEKEVNTELPKINTEIKKVETEKKNTTEEKKNVEAKNTTENKNIIEEKNVTENKNTVEEIKTTENKDAAKEKKSNTTKNTNKLEDNVISEQKSNNVIEKTDSKNVVISD